MTKHFAQLDIDNICVGITTVERDEINMPEYNYTTGTKYDPITDTYTESEPEFVSRMIEVPVCDEAFLGLRYNDKNKWERVEIE